VTSGHVIVSGGSSFWPILRLRPGNSYEFLGLGRQIAAMQLAAAILAGSAAPSPSAKLLGTGTLGGWRR
jgi:hypothetical protein